LTKEANKRAEAKVWKACETFFCIVKRRWCRKQPGSGTKRRNSHFKGNHIKPSPKAGGRNYCLENPMGIREGLSYSTGKKQSSRGRETWNN
jgi:hypothetical protein